MSMTETYAEWLTLRVFHEYYGIHRVPLAVAPTEETRRLLGRYGILFRPSGPNGWHLLAPAGKPLPTADDPSLVFVLKPLDMRFYYCTGAIRSDPAFGLSVVSEPRAWRRLEIPAVDPQADSPRRLEIRITAAERYWEYLLIPRAGAVGIVPELCDEGGEVAFRYAGIVTLPDASQACRFVTTHRIALREAYSYQLSLWEPRKAGRRLLSDTLPFPDPAEGAVTGAEDTIAVYCYY